MNDFKIFKTQHFDNIKVVGMYEREAKPVELIANVTFTVAPTSESDKITGDEFKDELKKHLSLWKVDKNVSSSLKLTGWQFDGSRYTYGHDYTQVRKTIDRVSSLGIDFYFIQTDEAEDVELFFRKISEQIAELEVFKSSEYFVIRPNRKNAKKNKS